MRILLFLCRVKKKLSYTIKMLFLIETTSKITNKHIYIHLFLELKPFKFVKYIFTCILYNNSNTYTIYIYLYTWIELICACVCGHRVCVRSTLYVLSIIIIMVEWFDFIVCTCTNHIFEYVYDIYVICIYKYIQKHYETLMFICKQTIY